MSFARASYINQPVPIEEELMVLFKKHAPLTIFEIGACEGEDSVRYANLFPRATIYAFEPLPKNLERISATVAKYDKTNITVVPFALSNITGVSVFYVSSGAPEGEQNNMDWDFGNKSSSLLPPDKHIDIVKFIDFKNKIEVETITLHEFCNKNCIGCIDFIHMDVQGAELMVLTGAKELIRSIKAVWLEVSKVTLYKDQPLYDEVKEFMIENGFVLIKDTVDDVTGDHLYISKHFFPDYINLFKRHAAKKNSAMKIVMIKKMFTRVIKKLFIA